jgi:hypothetical protein
MFEVQRTVQGLNFVGSGDQADTSFTGQLARLER